MSYNCILNCDMDACKRIGVAIEMPVIQDDNDGDIMVTGDLVATDRYETLPGCCLVLDVVLRNQNGYPLRVLRGSHSFLLEHNGHEWFEKLVLVRKSFTEEDLAEILLVPRWQRNEGGDC